MYELHQACANGNSQEVTRLVIDQNHHVNQAMPDGSTPIVIALKNGHLNIAAYFLELSNFSVSPPVGEIVFKLLNGIALQLQRTASLDFNKQVQLHNCFYKLGKKYLEDVDYEFASTCFEKAYKNISPALAIAGAQHDTYSRIAVNTLFTLAQSIGAENQLELAYEKLLLALNLVDKIRIKDVDYKALKIKVLNEVLENQSRRYAVDEAVETSQTIAALLLDNNNALPQQGLFKKRKADDSFNNEQKEKRYKAEKK